MFDTALVGRKNAESWSAENMYNKKIVKTILSFEFEYLLRYTIFNFKSHIFYVLYRFFYWWKVLLTHFLFHLFSIHYYRKADTRVSDYEKNTNVTEIRIMKYMRKKCFDASLILRYFRADSSDAAGLYCNSFKRRSSIAFREMAL